MIIADLHVHSRYARACSRSLTLENIAQWCRIKGIDIVACGDFTHPLWFQELSDKLYTTGNGLYQLKTDVTVRPIHFILGTEVSCIYTQGGKGRRVHLLIYFPSLIDVKNFNQLLLQRGANLQADGRPIIGLSAQEVVAIAVRVSDMALVIPAHIWTPWYAVFGSKSGFDSVTECFGDYSNYIYGLETGLSSDPAMNYLLSALDNYALISGSDAHSLENLGREATVFDLPELSYAQIFQAIKTNDQRLVQTLEFFPQEGKYYWDGHATCKFSCAPLQTSALNEVCPGCGRKLTLGVLNQITRLADRSITNDRKSVKPYQSIIPLMEIIADALQASKKSKKVLVIYMQIINQVGNEFFVLLNAPIALIAKASSELIAQKIKQMREWKVQIKPGYDGVYGVIKCLNE